jgi:purine-nucleoside/S-methyl-5'-thioadenosine phosphorylase / adenosine deaminase
VLEAGVRQKGAGQMSAPLAERIHPEARSRFAVRMLGDTPVIEARLPRPFRAFFTTRVGGASSGPFASLNLDPRSTDDPARVTANRERIALDTGRRLVSPLQVHGLRVVGASEYVCEPEPTPCDGLTLNPVLDGELAAVLLFADCVPLVLCGDVDMAVAHGGWRGILGGIAQQAGAAMTGAPGMAAVGPSIGPCCFTVGQEVADAFADRYGAGVVLEPLRPGGSHRVDLWESAVRALAEVGIPRGAVANPRLCTVCNNDLFYSYRLEGPVTGRHGCVAWAGAA